MISYPLHIIRFVFLILLQVLIINNIDLGDMNYYISPFIYILFLLVLPNSTNLFLLMFLGFITGLTMDIFMDTYGVHASACTLVAFMRPTFSKQLEDPNTYSENKLLTIYNGDRYKYIYYIAFLSFIFALWLFLLEEFSFRYLHIIILKAILSAIFSTLLMIIGQFLLFQKPTN